MGAMDGREIAEDRAARRGRFLPGWSLLASAGFHGLVALIFPLIALFGVAPLPEEEPVLRVTVLEDGPGDAGASGGADGGGGDRAAIASAPEAERMTQEAPAEAPSEAQETPPQPPQAAAAPALRPAPPAPPLPRHKPRPPERHPVAAERPATAPPIPQAPEIAQAPGPSPQVAAAGAGSGPGGPAGTGEGAEGAGAGSMGNDAGPGDDYLERVKRWIRKFQTYPDAARDHGQEGIVMLDIDLARDGTVLDVRIARSSGYPLLDQAALDMVHEASPVPPFPAQYRRERGTMGIPAIYNASVFQRVFGSR
jgi:protein TonB